MKALILNSGLGTRMGVLTSQHPKCMTEIYGNETILSRQLRQLNDYDINDVVITTGYGEDVLKQYIDSLNISVSISFVNNDEFKSTNYIYSIYCARDLLDDDIILIHGDLVYENSVLEDVLSSKESVMIVSSTESLPEKDFKAVINEERISAIGVDFFENSYSAQPLYKLNRADWSVWLKEICKYCEVGNVNVYAENAFNDVSDNCCIFPFDIHERLCKEIDTPDDLDYVKKHIDLVENRIVYVSFSTDIVHSGHIKLIKKARRLGKIIIGVISDEVVASYKRFPMLPYDERKALFENISGVYKVVKQETLSYRDNILKYKPDYVVHGDDWKEGFQKPIRDEVENLLQDYGGKLIEYPYARDIKYALLERRASYEQRIINIENKYDILDNWLKNYHIKSLLLVCGKNVEYHPLYKHILNMRESLGIMVTRFSDFEPNPKYESAVKGVELFNCKQCDSILALGGGSTMDVAKCIKLFATMDNSMNYLSQRIEDNNIPLMVIPTTAGTGSEVTRYAVLYYNGIKQSITHEECIPSMVFIDPSFLRTVPDYYRKSTMLDALCHCIESFWSINSTPESKAYAKEAISIILDNEEAYLKNDPIGNVNMLRASQLAGKAINITQTTAGHAMCYMITSLYGVAHGLAAALCVERLWPYMIEHTSECVDKRGERYLTNTLRELATAFDCDTPVEASSKFSGIMRRVNIKLELKQSGISNDIDKLADNVKQERLRNHPIRLSKEVIADFYRQILE